MQNDDPLNLSALANSYDNLLTEISTETQHLAAQLYAHVEEHARNSQLQINSINSLLSSVQQTLSTTAGIDNNIQLLYQLLQFTNDFNQRLSDIEFLIANGKL